ncbi:MAG: leucyl aminopeptidase family protein [Paracoccus sp. (in: a-proteobacteria)]|nr:leucyl aminopeptidase family protein [Paracoccus sp. (in: a-proteobacteria)]
MTPTFARADADAKPLYLAAGGLPEELDDAVRQWATACGFTGKSGEICLIPGPDGVAGALYGIGAADRLSRDRFAPSRAATELPEGDWRLANLPDGVDAGLFALGWLFSHYAFDRYKSCAGAKARLVAPDGVDAARLEAMARAEFLTRDLINTPANDMGPAALEAAARELAHRCGYQVKVIAGDDLLAQGFPLIHTVGRAGAEAPRLIELTRGETGPALTLVGKGVCFDTGGLNLKPGASMGLMKKDMGGAASVLGLAQMLAETGAGDGLRLRVLIPAVENAVAGNAFRPGDVLRSRKGLSVEVNNTDAEGRLVLADALAYGAEAAPDLMISMATLTGAARVALGPDLPPLYCDDDATAQALLAGGAESGDPLWRMPFWDGYESLIEPAIADLDNAPSGGMAGSITAALFLRRFAQGAGRYAHLDIYGWRPTTAPARTKGGLGQGARAVLAALPRLL